tara:strand:- start:911 stop:1630 length:720 start_codon:yes stop_codon:yes gene_type:complete
MEQTEHTQEKPHQVANFWPKIIFGVPFTIAFFWGYMWLGGGVRWWQGWLMLGVMFVGETLRAVYVSRKQPEMFKRRGEFGEGTQSWDKAWLTVFGLVLTVMFVIGPLDGGRYLWAPLPVWTIPIGIVLYILYLVFFGWAMSVNPHFEKTVRLQEDRGHKVITTGPYAYIRHPGYIGSILGFGIAPPLMMCSAWALVPGLLLIPCFMVRTAWEDAFLQRELDGYAAYAQKVKYKLFPGLW